MKILQWKVVLRFLGFCQICFILSTIVPALSSAETPYTFERMWPTLKHPWYFFNLSYVATDNGGAIYVSDTTNNRIQKFTIDGTFITTWGGEGQFLWPQGVAEGHARDHLVGRMEEAVVLQREGGQQVGGGQPLPERIGARVRHRVGIGQVLPGAE